MGRRSTVRARRSDRASTISGKEDLVLQDILARPTTPSDDDKEEILRTLSDKDLRDEIIQQLNLVLSEGSNYEHWERYSVFLNAVCIRSGKPKMVDNLLGEGKPFSLNESSGNNLLPSSNLTLANHMEYRMAAIIEMLLLSDMELGMKITDGVEYSELDIDLKSASKLKDNSFSCQMKSPLQRLIGLGYNLFFFRTNKGRYNQAKKDGKIPKENLEAGIRLRLEDDDHSALLRSYQTADKNVTDIIEKVHSKGHWSCENLEIISHLVHFLREMRLVGIDNDLRKELLNSEGDNVEVVLRRIVKHQQDKSPKNLDSALENALQFSISAEVMSEIIDRINSMIKSNKFGGLITWSYKKETTMKILQQAVPHETMSQFRKRTKDEGKEKDLLEENFE